MSTFKKRDGVELDKLIAGDIYTWNSLRLEWNDLLFWHCQVLECRNADGLIGETWTRVQRAVGKWKPGIDARKGADGKPEVIDRALTLNYVQTVLKRLAIADTARQQHGELVVSLDTPIDDEGGTRASQVPDIADRGVPKEAQLFDLVTDLETKRLGDEGVATAFVQALLDEGLLLARALEWLIELADPALEEVHQQVVVRRWQLAQNFAQIGHDLAECARKGRDMKDKHDFANWASNQHQAALKRMRRGLEKARRE